MREEILTNLKRAVGYYNEIALIHSAKLPKTILDGTRSTVEKDIPRHLNNFISIINMVEEKKAYPEISNIQTGIQVFSNSELDKSIEKALGNTNVVGIGGNEDMSAKQILEYSEDAIRDCVQLLQLQIAAAKLSR